MKSVVDYWPDYRGRILKVWGESNINFIMLLSHYNQGLIDGEM